jgi:hypothetical protein
VVGAPVEDESRRTQTVARSLGSNGRRSWEERCRSDRARAVAREEEKAKATFALTLEAAQRIRMAPKPGAAPVVSARRGRGCVRSSQNGDGRCQLQTGLGCARVVVSSLGSGQLKCAELYCSHGSGLVHLISFIPMIFQAFSNAPPQKYK